MDCNTPAGGKAPEKGLMIKTGDHTSKSLKLVDLESGVDLVSLGVVESVSIDIQPNSLVAAHVQLIPLLELKAQGTFWLKHPLSGDAERVAKIVWEDGTELELKTPLSTDQKTLPLTEPAPVMKPFLNIGDAMPTAGLPYDLMDRRGMVRVSKSLVEHEGVGVLLAIQRSGVVLALDLSQYEKTYVMCLASPLFDPVPIGVKVPEYQPVFSKKPNMPAVLINMKKVSL